MPLPKAGTEGTRAAPSQMARDDEQYEVRIDFGQIFPKDSKTIQQYNLQLNSNPDNSNLRSLIRKHGTHHVWATAERELKNSNENVSTEKMRDEIEELFDEFNKNKIEEDKTEGDTTRKDKSEANKKKS